MAEGLTYTFYIYSDAGVPLGKRWQPIGLRDIFFTDCEEAECAMRSDIAADPDMVSMATKIEKVVTVPISHAYILLLLKRGPGAFVADCEILENIV